ncbi:MAG: hypothetical protein V1887_01960 [Candidatus Aenigmatarchaeota archaeon]
MTGPIDITNALRCIYAFAEDPTGELPQSGPYSFEQVVLTLRAPPRIVRDLLKEMIKGSEAEMVPCEGRWEYMFSEGGLGTLYGRLKKGPVQRTID